MPAKVSKSAAKPAAKSVAAAKPAAKTAAAKPTVAAAKPAAAATVLRLTEEEKAGAPDTYILNTNTSKHVLRNSVIGKKMVKAQLEGVAAEKPPTDTERLLLVIKALQDHLGEDACSDADIKAAMEPIVSLLPRGFPNTWGGRTRMRNKDHPRAPCNAYIYFMKANRASIVLANPGLVNHDYVKLIGVLWNETASEDRVEYEKLAAADKIRYETEMVVFEAEYPEEARQKTPPGSEKPTKETAYRLYCDEHREATKAENSEMDGKQIIRLLAEQWDALKKSDKAKADEYQLKADEFNADFEERVSVYHSSPNSSPPKLSKAEQAKANDPVNYELNTKTGRYVRKEVPKKESPKAKGKAASTVKKPAKKVPEKKVEKKVDEKKADVDKTDEEVEVEDEDADLLME
jgi:proteasome lid subunit RPN8/RPN11